MGAYYTRNQLYFSGLTEPKVSLDPITSHLLVRNLYKIEK